MNSEFDGLRELIEGGSDEEDELDDSQSAETIESTPSFIFQDARSMRALHIVNPSNAHIASLLEFYLLNVDPVCKILHRPTVTAYFSDLEKIIDPLTHEFKFRSLAAVSFAAYFAAVASMSAEECMLHLGESKEVLIARYRESTEAALVGADFLNSLDIIPLQALTIYIVSSSSMA